MLQNGYFTRREGFGDHRVGALGVDADPTGVAPVELPGPGQFAFGVVAKRNQNGLTGFGTTAHAPGVGAMHSEYLAAGQLAIGQEAFVATEQSGGG